MSVPDPGLLAAGPASALLVGVLAGLAVAVPVGPVGVLLLREGLLRGTRVAVGAALGVASVDAVYALLAVLVGVPVGRTVDAHAGLVRLVSAGVLLLVGVVGVVGALRARHPPDAPVLAGSVPVSVGAGTGPRRAYARFVALTAVNPTTAVTFATVAVGAVAGLAGAGAGGGAGGAPTGAGRLGPAVGAAFVVGVALASVAWQLLLALGGGLLRDRLGGRGRTALSVGGSLVVVGLAAGLLLG